MSDDILVDVDGVSKKFCRNLKRSLWYGVKDTTADLVGRANPSASLRRDEFWAVDNVSLEVRRGECVGLLGRNGAGKTTLLKILNGLIKPDKGRVEIRGNVGALIALGAGFNPILTGRENIYVNGAVLGLSKRDIDRKLDEIVDFAEIGEFLDTPVQSYSSGMYVRLGFAIAAHVKPDVLLIDEILAVGDPGFRIKCYNKIYELRERIATIFISHSMAQIGKVCTSGVIMRFGRAISEKTTIAEAIQCYLQQFDGPGVSRGGNGVVEIERIALRQGCGGACTLYPSEAPDGHGREIDPSAETVLELDCLKKQTTGSIVVLWSFADMEQKLVAQAISDVLRHETATQRFSIRTKISALNLNGGRYSLSLHVYEVTYEATKTVLAGLHDFASIFVQSSMFVGSAPILLANQTEIGAAVVADFDDRFALSN